MPVVHAKRIRISQKNYKDLAEELAQDTYAPKRRDGFVLSSNTPQRLAGKYVYPKLIKVKSIDPESLEPVIEERRVLAVADFTLLPARGLLLTSGPRSDLSVIEEAFGAYASIQAETEDLNSNMVEVYRDFRDCLGKTELKSVKIQDYFGREGIVTTANFKLAAEGSESNLLSAWGEEARGFTISVLTAEGRDTISVTSKGTLRFSEGVSESDIETLLSLLTKHHEEVLLEDAKI